MPTINIRWASNVEELKRNLRSGLDQIEATRAAADKLAKSLSGENIIRAAHNYAAAIDRLGGVSKLTEANQARVNAVMTKAVEVLNAAGKSSSTTAQLFQALADQTKSAEASTTGWTAVLQSLGTSFVARVAEGVLLRDAIHGVLGGLRDLTVGLVSNIGTMALQGAAVADVEDNYKRLTAQAGLLGDQLLGALRAGTHNTVTDFELMKRANQNLAAGLNLTTDQFGLLAKGAFALSQATGVNVASALDTMSDAMVTGKTKALALLTGKIDLEKAEKAYAASLGSTREHLTEQGKVEAARVAILKSVGEALGRLGEQTDGLDERVAQAGVAWANFKDELGKSVATSTVLETGLKGLQQILIDTFGGRQQTLVEAVTRAIESAEIAVVHFGQSGVQVGGFIAKEFIALEKIIGDVQQLLSSAHLLSLLAQRAVLTGTVGEKSPAEVAAINANAAALNELIAAIKNRGAALKQLDQDQKSIDTTTGDLTKKLADLEAKMIAARAATDGFVGPLTKEDDAARRAAKSTADHAGSLQRSNEEIAKAKAAAAQFAAAMVELDSATGGWARALDDIDGAVVEAVKFYLHAGVAQDKLAKAYALTEVQIKAIVTGVEAEKRLHELNTMAIVDETSAWEKLGKQDNETIRNLKAKFDLLDKLREVQTAVIGAINEQALRDAGVRTDVESIGRLKGGIDAAEKKAKQFEDELENLSNAFARLAQIGGKTFSGFVQAIGRGIASWSLLTKAAKEYHEAVKAGSKVGQAAALLTSGVAVFDFVTTVANLMEAGDRRAKAILDSLRNEFGLTFTELQHRATQAGISVRDFRNALAGSEAAVRRLREAFSLQDESLKLFNDTAKKYKLTLAELGKGGAQAQILQRAIDLLQDFKILTAGGVDQDTVLKKMSKSLNQLVQDALKTGSALPEALRPALERMIQLGTLTDAAGHRLTSLAGITFTQTLSQQFESLIQHIDRLAQAIANVFKVALDGYRTTVGRIRPPGTPSDGVAIPRPPHGATGGLVTQTGIQPFTGRLLQFLPRGSDTVAAMLTPGEMVVNASQQRELASAVGDGTVPRGGWSSGETHVHQHFNLRGAYVDEALYRRLARKIGPHIASDVAQNKQSMYSRLRAATGQRS